MSCCFYKGDCLEQMKKLPDSSIQLILWDPPFNSATRNSWDSVLDWKSIFPECFRVLKNTGMLVIHCSVPFNYELIRAAPKPPNYSWYWNKKQNTCPLLANQQPLRCVEEILVWRKNKNTYYRQQIGDEPHTAHYMTPNTYYGNPGMKSGNKVIKGKTRNHYIEMNRELDGFSTRPQELIELLIKSYTQEGDTVLDPTCYKGLSGMISKKLGRHWKGFDLNFLPELLMKS